MTRKVMPYVLQ